MDEEKVKTKGISESENLDQALEDEELDLPTIVPPQQDRSTLLIEEIDSINIGTEDTPKNVLISKSLMDQ